MSGFWIILSCQQCRHWFFCNKFSLTEFKPKISKIEEKEEVEQKSKVLVGENENIEIQQLFKPNNKIMPIFQKQGKEIKFYTLKECKDILFSYIRTRQLGIDGTNESKIDDLLWSGCKLFL